MSAHIQIHFDGPIAKDHKLSLRNLGMTLDRLQNAVDRAYLDTKYRGGVWKNARLLKEDYEQTDFILNHPEEGGFILGMESIAGEAIVKRMRQALISVERSAFEAGEKEAARLLAQVEKTKRLVETRLQANELEKILADPNEQTIRRYGDKSIAKEINHILTLIRSKKYEGSSLDINLHDGKPGRTLFKFDEESAAEFNAKITQKSVGGPVVLEGRLRLLDRGGRYSRRKAKLINTANDRDINVIIATEEDFEKLHPFLTRKKNLVRLIAAPILEFGSFDPNGGDFYFVDLVNS